MARSAMTFGFLAAGAVLAAVVLLFAVFVQRQDRRLYSPTRRLAAAPQDLRLAADDVAVTTEDGERLQGWWIRGSRRRVVLYFSGNAGNVGDRLERARILNQRLGLDVLLV
ncbi:MAG TPA: hypothetical protein VGG65_08510, partial [Thermoanaerobaculia bacterium]